MSDNHDSTGSESVSSDESSSSSGEEDIVNPFERDFFKTWSCLKGKNPKIYDSSVKFFKRDKSKEVPTKNVKKIKDEPVFLKDFERKIITERGEKYSDDEEKSREEKTFVEIQKEIKNSFKHAFSKNERSDDDEEDNFCGVLIKREKTFEDGRKQEEEDDYIKWFKGQKKEVNDEVTNGLKFLHDYWDNPDLEEKEEFLRDFILNKSYIVKKEDSGHISDEIELSEDEAELEAQEAFEHKYNTRFEQPDELLICYPRNVEGSLRQKNDKRSRKGAEVQERKAAEKLKKREEIKQAQKVKLIEIEKRSENVKKLVGNDELGFTKEDILDDFDPEKFNKKMEDVYNDEFYAGKEESKPQVSENCDCEVFSNSYYEGDLQDATNSKYSPDFNMDCEAHLHVKSNKKESRTKKKKNKKKSFIDIASYVEPVYDPAVHESFQKYMDEFYSLDCEDFIDDIPCKFKYRSVEPNDFGLSIDEILMADDKKLNRWS